MSNEYETRARLTKAKALAEAWLHMARTFKDEPLTAELARIASIMAQDATDHIWSIVADLAGVKVPSIDTRLICILILSTQADSLAEAETNPEPDDPFASFQKDNS